MVRTLARTRRARQPGIVTLLVMVSFAGCAGSDVPPADPAEPVDEVLGFRYDCPPGATVTLSDGLCVTTFYDPRETFEEPYLAVHPQRPEVMALGMNAWHADPRPVLGPGGPSIEIGRVALFLTENGGVTWRRVASPSILYGTGEVGKTSYSGDPVVGFDPDGVLHYLQTSVAFDGLDSQNFPYIDIQYARSDDLGASWSQNLLLADDGDNDRPWLTIDGEGNLFAMWRNNIVEDRPPELRWSTDGGATWEGPVAAPPECSNGDRAIVRPEAVLLPCELHEGGTVTGLQINRFDRATEKFVPVGWLKTPAGWAPPDAHIVWDETHNGSVLGVATRQGAPGGFVAFSRDGGITWSQPLDLMDLCACETDTGSLHVYGARFGPWGGFHLLLADARVETPDSASEGNIRYATGERAVFHVVVRDEGDRLHAARLPTAAETDARMPPSAGMPIGRDDYYVPAFWDEGGAIVWTRDKGVDLTHVSRVDGASAATGAGA